MRLLQCSGHVFVSNDPVITIYIGRNQSAENSWIPEPPKCVRPDIILEHMPWDSPKSTLLTIKRRYEESADSIQRLLVVNTVEAERDRVNINLPGFFCNAGIFQREYIFRDLNVDESEITYDAIYNARYAKFKRHHLANRVTKLRVLTGGIGESLSRGKGLEAIRFLTHGAEKDLVNKSVSFEQLTEEEVCAEINKSHCGLALSQIEGVMRASMEYLLCGRPVVSTCSKGGRDLYYNPENCKIVADNPEAVKHGVKYWIKNPPDRAAIRRRVLSQINRYRYSYSRKISQLQESCSALAERPERIFYDLFLNANALARRFHAPDSNISRKKLSSLLVYPKTEILFKENGFFKNKAGGSGLAIQSKHCRVQLDEEAAWILAQLNGVRTISEIIDDLVMIYGNRDKIKEDVRDTIERFIEQDIVSIANHTK